MRFFGETRRETRGETRRPTRGDVPAESVAEAVEDVAITATRALRADGPGWVVVYSAVLREEVLWLRDQAVEVPAEYATLPRFDRDELALLVAQRPTADRLRAIVDV